MALHTIRYETDEQGEPIPTLYRVDGPRGTIKHLGQPKDDPDKMSHAILDDLGGEFSSQFYSLRMTHPGLKLLELRIETKEPEKSSQQ